MELSNTLDEIRKRTMENGSYFGGSMFANTLHALRTGGYFERRIKVGDRIPKMPLSLSDGPTICLTKVCESVPVILFFFRGYWCPFCKATLQAYAEIYPEVLAMGAEMIGFSPAFPDRSQQERSRMALPFPVVCDQGSEIAKTFGVAWEPTKDELAAYFKQSVLEQVWTSPREREPMMIPMPTVVIVAQNIVRWVDGDVDWTRSTAPSAMLRALSEMQREGRARSADLPNGMSR